MNLRKLFTLLNIIVIGLLTYCAYFNCEEFIYIGLTGFSFLFSIEVIYFLYEYFIMVNSGKAFLMDQRSRIFSIDVMVHLILFIVLVVAVVVNIEKILVDQEKATDFVLVAGMRFFLYYKLKYNAILLSDRILYNELFIKDLYIADIKSVSLDQKKFNVVFNDWNGKIKLLRLEGVFFINEFDKLQKMVNVINNQVQKDLINT